MAEGQAKLQEKADVLLLNSEAHKSICLISSTKGSVTYSWSDSLVGKVMGRKRQSSRDPLWEESSNLVLRDNYFDFSEWKKKKLANDWSSEKLLKLQLKCKGMWTECKISLTLARFNQGAKRNIMPRRQTTLGLQHRNADTFTNTSLCFEPWPGQWLLKSANCPWNIGWQFCGTSFLYNIMFAILVGSFSLRREWGCTLNYSCLKVVATDQG